MRKTYLLIFIFLGSTIFLSCEKSTETISLDHRNKVEQLLTKYGLEHIKIEKKTDTSLYEVKNLNELENFLKELAALNKSRTQDMIFNSKDTKLAYVWNCFPLGPEVDLSDYSRTIRMTSGMYPYSEIDVMTVEVGTNDRSSAFVRYNAEGQFVIMTDYKYGYLEQMYTDTNILFFRGECRVYFGTTWEDLQMKDYINVLVRGEGGFNSAFGDLIIEGAYRD